MEAGHAWLREELKRLRDERAPQLESRLREMQEDVPFDDLYLHLTRQELTRVRERIEELERTLAGEVGGAASHLPGVITIGSEVVARDQAGRVHTFVIVSPIEADASRGHISVSSPVATGLLGRRSGEQIAVTVPTGVRTFTVLSVA
jgi:transcription elongation factor GreA